MKDFRDRIRVAADEDYEVEHFARKNGLTPDHGQSIGIGDEVTITATILRLHDINGRASVSIPTSNFPYSIDAPKKAKPGDKVPLTGWVMRVDDEDRKVTVKVGGLVTVDQDSLTDWSPA